MKDTCNEPLKRVLSGQSRDKTQSIQSALVRHGVELLHARNFIIKGYHNIASRHSLSTLR